MKCPHCGFNQEPDVQQALDIHIAAWHTPMIQQLPLQFEIRMKPIRKYLQECRKRNGMACIIDCDIEHVWKETQQDKSW